jgi:hypothetical protein
VVIQHLRVHTPMNVIHDGSFAYTLTFTHLDGRRGGCGARDSRGSNCRTQFLHLNIKIDFIKQNYAAFYLWDPLDDKSEQDY